MTASARFLPVDRATFDGVMNHVRAGMDAKGCGGSVSDRVFGRELVYDIRLPYHPNRPPVTVSVFSSISATNTQARDVGEDAVRISIVAAFTDQKTGQPTERPIAKSVRLFRTAPTGIPHEQRLAAFAERLTAALREAYKTGMTSAHYCPACRKGVLLRRTTKTAPKRDFLGCSDWPACRHTAPAVD
jgi:hypothetical protein